MVSQPRLSSDPLPNPGDRFKVGTRRKSSYYRITKDDSVIDTNTGRHLIHLNNAGISALTRTSLEYVIKAIAATDVQAQQLGVTNQKLFVRQRDSRIVILAKALSPSKENLRTEHPVVDTDAPQAWADAVNAAIGSIFSQASSDGSLHPLLTQSLSRQG